MATNRRKKKKLPIAPIVVFIIALVIYLGASYLDFAGIDTDMLGIDIDLGEYNIFSNISDKPDGDSVSQTSASDTEVYLPPIAVEGEVTFHFIDVGQGDSILVTTAEGNMLIDTSVNGAKDELDAYFAKVGVTELEYLVLTHPDADHIGCADYIINNYQIKNILLTDYVATTKTYDRMLTAIENSEANVIIPEPGYTFSLGGLQNTVIAPNADYDDPNEMSIVFRAVFGNTAVMLTGDAEKESEADIVDIWSAADLKSTILKAGHHGSSTSSSQAFLDLVDPEIVVISCGADNKYGHPHDDAIARYEAMGLDIYRTDLQGTVVFKTDGTSFTYVPLTEE